MNILREIAISFQTDQDGFVFMWVLVGIAVAAGFLIIDRLLSLKSRTDVDDAAFTASIKNLIDNGDLDQALKICHSSGKRALPRIIGAGVAMARRTPGMIRSAVEEETLHMLPMLEKRLNLILMLGNVATLLGLMGTIYGLILSFAAVASQDVAAVEKSALLADGISTAMNTTLLGLIISVPCIAAFSFLRSVVDSETAKIDRHISGILRVLMPKEIVSKNYRASALRIKEEVDTEPNIAPMMNLMVILIPLLLTSAEFVKIGAIELKLPSSGGAANSPQQQLDKPVNLDLGIVISKEGFTTSHYFKSTAEQSSPQEDMPAEGVEIPLKAGEYDYELLNKKLQEVKRQALLEIARAVKPDLTDDITLIKLDRALQKQQALPEKLFADNESVKIVAEPEISYQVVVSVMDAARGTRTELGNITLFPNVSLAGGVTR